MGIEDILKQNDEKRTHSGDARQGAYERGLQARFVFSERVALALLAAVVAMRDRAIGEPVRLPIAAKPSETGVFIECEGLVRLTLHCVIRADPNGVAYCSSIDLAMSRGGRIVRGTFEPIRGSTGLRANKLGYTEKQFTIDQPKFVKAIEALAHQL
jgi:hypothetical protein